MIRLSRAEVRGGHKLTSKIVYPWCFGESEEVVKKEDHVDGLINNEVMPGLRYITSLIVYREC